MVEIVEVEDGGEAPAAASEPPPANPPDAAESASGSAEADATLAPDAGPEEITEGDAAGAAVVIDEGTEAAVAEEATEATSGETLEAAPEVAEPEEPAERLPSPRELKKIDDARMLELIETAEEEISGLKHENTELQRRVWTMQKKRRSLNTEQFILEGQEAFYKARLNNWSETKEEFERLKSEYDNKIDTLREMLKNKQQDAHDQHEGMIDYMWQVARESADSISRMKIPNRVLNELQQEGRDTAQELQSVRIRGRQLRSQLGKLEHTLELKDQLPGGLHLVDFEQLKMENESLNEKIHSKNEALSSLRKKSTNLVHTLAHVREKLQHVVHETKVNGEELAADDKTIHQGRIKLNEIKTACAAIKRKKESLMKNVVHVTAPALLDDMEFQREDIEVAREKLQQLKSKYLDLMDKIKKDQHKLAIAVAGAAPRPDSPPIETDPLRWGTKRTVLGNMVA